MSESTVCLNVRSQVEKVISELQGVHELMLSSDLDPAVLANFRDSLNRVRNTAWAAQQYVARGETDQDSSSVLSFQDEIAMGMVRTSRNWNFSRTRCCERWVTAAAKSCIPSHWDAPRRSLAHTQHHSRILLRLAPSLRNAAPRAGAGGRAGPGPKSKSGVRGVWGPRQGQYSHLQLCGWFLTLPHAPLSRRCVFDP
jgi:hypothetical protein